MFGPGYTGLFGKVVGGVGEESWVSSVYGYLLPVDRGERSATAPVPRLPACCHSSLLSPKLDVFFYKMSSLIMVFYHGNRKAINVRNITYTHICNDVSQQITPLSIIFSSRQTTVDEQQTINIF